MRTTLSKPQVSKPRRSFLNLAAQTPPERDRYVDFLRAFSICVVVLGHWLATVVQWEDGRLVGVNAVEAIPKLWISTWLLQVMPLFFFVGGFSNLVTWDSIARKGGSYLDFVHQRAHRLLRPTAVLLAVWFPLSVALEVFFSLDGRAFERSMMLLTAPLWFLAVYLMMIALAPRMLRFHRRFGRAAAITLGIGAVLVDTLSIGIAVPFVGGLNYLFIWLFAHQLGFFYADGSLLRLGRRSYLLLAGAGLLALVTLTTWVGYSPNMVFNIQGRSNTNPPTVALLALTVMQIGLVMFLRAPACRVLARPKPWAGVIALNSVMMTTFLWHMTAAVIVVVFAYPLGFPAPDAGTAMWWALRPVWLLMLLATLLPLILAFGRFERGRPSRPASNTPRQAPARSQKTATVLGLVYCILGFVGFATASLGGATSTEPTLLMGISMHPLQAVLHLGLGWILVNAGFAGSDRARLASWGAVGALAFFGIAGITVFESYPGLNIVGANGAVHGLHLGSAIAGAAGLLFRGRSN